MEPKEAIVVALVFFQKRLTKTHEGQQEIKVQSKGTYKGFKRTFLKVNMNKFFVI
jgi:hypothetical protein